MPTVYDPFQNYDPWTGQGTIDEAYLATDLGKAYARDNPEQAINANLSKQVGGYANASDTMREWLQNQRRRLMAQDAMNANLRKYGATGWGSYGDNGDPYSYLNQGLGAALSPNVMTNAITGLLRAGIENPNAGIREEVQNYIGSTTGRRDLSNAGLWGMPSTAPATSWLSRLDVADRPGGSAKSYFDYLRRLYGQL